jgi:chorismate synthase
MSGNTLGLLFTVTSFGESHGAGIGCIVDGCPPGMDLSIEDIQAELDRRKPGTSRHVTQRKEPDTVEILSGIYEGKTTGTPIALLIRNQDQRSQDYGKIVETFRPGHADYTYWHKYGIRDPRGGGRSSARETAVRVAAGAIAKKWLREKYGIEIRGYMSKLGELEIPFNSWDEVNGNAFFAPNAGMVPQLEDYMDAIRKERDSVGAQITVVAEHVPVGLGEPVYDRLDAEIAYAMMSINAVKGVEVGAGFASIAQKGSVHCDELTPTGFASNHAGGILGGISTGQDIVVSLAVKPTSSIAQERNSIDKEGNPVLMATTGRHDPCVGIRATPIAEAMLALVLIDHALRHRAQCGDVKVGTPQIPAKRI